MKRLTFWFDVISPYAYLAFERLPEALAGLPVAISYRPLLFAGLLNQWGQKGPAEIEPKRAWTFRHVAWLAHRYGVTLQTPAQHPFNPLALLRLATACAPMGEMPGRSVCGGGFPARLAGWRRCQRARTTCIAGEAAGAPSRPEVGRGQAGIAGEHRSGDR